MLTKSCACASMIGVDRRAAASYALIRRSSREPRLTSWRPSGAAKDCGWSLFTGCCGGGTDWDPFLLRLRAGIFNELNLQPPGYCYVTTCANWPSNRHNSSTRLTDRKATERGKRNLAITSARGTVPKNLQPNQQLTKSPAPNSSTMANFS